MPFSRSRSPESMTRSTTAWFSRNTPGLAEHRVDERGLAVVDVGDDGDVAQVARGRRGWSAVGTAVPGRSFMGRRVSHRPPFRAIEQAVGEPARSPRGTRPGRDGRRRRPAGRRAARSPGPRPRASPGRGSRRSPSRPLPGRPCRMQQHDPAARSRSRAGRWARRRAGAAAGWRAPGRSRPAAARRPTARAAGGWPARRGRRAPAAPPRARSRSPGSAPTSRSGTSTFSAADRIGISPKVWNTNATCCGARPRTRLGQAGDLRPVDHARCPPSAGRGRRAG